MSARFIVEPTPLAGCCALTRAPLGDERGFLERLFCSEDLGPLWGQRPIAQINRTVTATKGTLRGMHFQHVPAAECKYVTCLRGVVYDVAVDLRADSASFGRWFGLELSGASHNALIIPEGFAHGFQTLSDDVEMLYLHSAAYNAGCEGGVNAHDRDLAIDWPLPVTLQSPRDQALPPLTDIKGITP